MDNLNPNSSPNGLNERPKPTVGKHLNKLPLAIGGGIVFVILMSLLYAASLRTNTLAEETSTITNYPSTSANQNSVENLLSDLKKDSGNPPSPERNSNNIILPTEQQLAANQSLGLASSTDRRKELLEEEELRILLQKRQAYSAALMAKTSVVEAKTVQAQTAQTASTSNGGFSNRYPPSGYNDSPMSPSSTIDASMDRAKAIASSLMPQQEPTNNQARNEGFLEKENSYDYLSSKKTAPISPYEIKSGTIIPGTLVTGINSDLPGQILAQVRENIYDTATGRYLLIPQGSKLVGSYSANVQYGQRRVLIAWGRLIYPDGSTLDLNIMNGIDQEGYAGFSDLVNNHYLRIFGSALMFSGITGGIAIANKGDGNTFKESDSEKMYAAIISEMGQVAKQMIQKNMDIAPTIEIRPGYRFNVFVTQDIILEPLPY